MKIEYLGKDKNTVRIIKEKGEKGFRKPESCYWVRVPEKWWRYELKGLSCIQRCILISLRVWGHLRASKSQLARELGVSRLTIRKHFKILKEKRFIK